MVMGIVQWAQVHIAVCIRLRMKASAKGTHLDFHLDFQVVHVESAAEKQGVEVHSS